MKKSNRLLKRINKLKKDKKILILASNYYEDICDRLIDGATDLIESFNKSKRVNIKYDIKYAPGSFEIPFLINKKLKLYDGFIAIGCIIRGKTYHFELISNEVTRKIMDISIYSNKPIGFGVITCENMKQANERSLRDSKNNKGREAAKACIGSLFEFTIINRNNG